MSKRFIDTKLFDDPWFMDLSKDAKLFWIYLITRCNHAGIIELNKRLIGFQTDIQDLSSVIKELDNRLVRVTEQLIFIPKFIYFQYPKFPQSKVKQQIGAIEILTKYNLFKDGKLTVNKELINSYGNGNDNDNGNGNVEHKISEKSDFGEMICIYDFETLKKELFKEIWLESIAMASYSKGISMADLKKQLLIFCETIRDTKDFGKPIKNYQNHFVHWFQKQPGKQPEKVKAVVFNMK